MNTTIIAANGNRSFSVNETSLITTQEGIFQKVRDHIADFFCRTNIVEAKQHLRNFLDVNKPKNERAKSFIALRSLCSTTCQKSFKVSTALDQKGVSFRIGTLSSLETKNLAKVDLRAIDLKEINLKGIDLYKANLSGKDLL